MTTLGLLYNGGTHQKWQLAAEGSYYHLVNRNSGKYADVASGSTADGAKIIQYASNGGTNQDVAAEAQTEIPPVSGVPEPSTVVLFGLGIGGLLAVFGRRLRKR